MIAHDWLGNFDSHREEIERVLRRVHGGETALWRRRWGWFLRAVAGLFGYANGSEWVSAITGCRMWLNQSFTDSVQLASKSCVSPPYRATN